MKNERKKNILLITTDQQRYDTISDKNHDFVKTPNLDNLIKDGRLYNNCYCAIPACMPSRQSILCGQYSSVHNIDHNYFNNEEFVPYNVPSFPEFLTESNYDTQGIGKMHFIPVRKSNGFNHLKLMEEIPDYIEDDEYTMFLKEKGYGKFQSIHGVRHHLYMQPQESMFPEELHGSSWVANETISAMDKLDGSRPFMYWTSFISPHPPFDVPQSWAHMYDDVELPPLVESETPISSIAVENSKIGEYENKERQDRSRRLYYCSLSFVDFQIGKIIQKLKEKDLYDDTLIVFTSDHGEMLGDCGTFQKFLPYDFSSKVPFIVKPPKDRELSVESNEVINQVDLFPTFMDIANISNPLFDKLPGESLFSKERIIDRTYTYVEYHRCNKRWISLASNTYKYNYYYGGGKEELFDLVNDPFEKVNLLFGSNIPQDVLEIKETYRSELIKKEEQLGPQGYVVDDDFIVLDPYQPNYFVERNFPKFPTHLKDEEKKNMVSLNDELKIAIEKEPVMDDFKVEKLEVIRKVYTE
jgi:arylsulfatase A-like enzyme